MKGKSSLIWNHFNLIHGSDIAKCCVCNAKLSHKAKGTTSNLRQHFHRKHPHIYIGDRKNQQDISVVVSTENADENIKFIYPESMEEEPETPVELTQQASTSSKKQLRHNLADTFFKRKSSLIWNFFQLIPGSNSKVNCSICNAELSYYKGTTSNLRQHIHRKHPHVYIGDRKNQQSSIVVSTENGDENIKFIYPESMEEELEPPVEPRQEASSSSKDQLGQNLANTFFKRKSSLIWNFFHLISGSNSKVNCSICNTELNYFKGTTSNLRQHIHRKHPHVYIGDRHNQQNAEENIKLMYPESMQQELETPAEPTQEASTSSKNLLGQNLKCSKGTEINDALLRLFTVDLQPLSIVEDSGFKSFVKALNPTYRLPSRKIFTDSLLPAAYEEAYNASRNILDDIPSVTLTTDCWNSSNTTESFMTITGHFINNNFEKKSIMLECSSFGKPPTSLNLSTQLARVANEWNLNEKVLIVISDNSDNIVKAVNDLNLEHFGCFAQKLNLIAEDILKLISDNMDKVRTIVGHFKRNTSCSSKFVNQQRQSGLLPKHLIQSVPTRWNSTFYMLERFTELEEPLRITLALINEDLPQLSVEEWNFLTEVVKILKPLESITKMMSEKKYITASSILILTDGLIDVYSNLAKQEFTQSAKRVINAMLDGLNGRLGDLERNESLVLATFLDPRFKNIGFSDEITSKVAREQIEALLTEMINNKYEDMTQPEKETIDLEDSIWSKFDKKIATSQPTGNAHSKAVLEIEHYLEEPLISRSEDPLLWWKNNSFNLPNLSDLVRLRFIPIATSVPCERLFTKTGQVLSDRRTRLSSSKVKSVLFLNTMSEKALCR